MLRDVIVPRVHIRENSQWPIVSCSGAKYGDFNTLSCSKPSSVALSLTSYDIAT